MKLSFRGTLLIVVLAFMAPCAAIPDEFVFDMEGYEVSDPGLAEVSRLEHAGRVDEAAQLLDLMKENGVGCSPDHIPAGVADFMAARMYENAGNQRMAVARYRDAAASPLGDPASWRLGRLLTGMGDTAGARTAYGSVSSASSFWMPARMALASSLLAEGRPDGATSVLRGILDTDVSGGELADVRLALADAAYAKGDTGLAVSIATLAYMEAGDSRRVRLARGMLDRLGLPHDGILETLRKISRANRRELKNLDVVARKRPAAFAQQDPAFPYVIRAAYALASHADPGKALDLLAKAAELVRNPDVSAFLWTLKGEALVEMDDDAGAAMAWARVVSEHPRSPFAPEAGYSGARAFMRAGTHSNAVSLLKMVEDRVPAGGSALSLRWERALAAMIASDLPEALSALDGILAIVDHGDGLLFGPAERARYFRGVVLHDMGETDEARLELERVARSSEYSWFGILARSRLGLWYGVRFQNTAVGNPDAGKFDGVLPSNARPFDLSNLDGVRVTGRAVGPLFLHRMGDRAGAEAELVARARRGLLSEADLRLLAMFKASTPEPAKAMRAASWLRGDYVQAADWVFSAAYPRPYSVAVEAAAGRFDVDPAVVFGVMRAESNFRPTVRSPAGAYGLMQIMRPTGRTIIRKVLTPAGISASLQKPSGNVMIGTALIDRLIVHFDGYLPLVLASYNAGSGSGRRFMRTLGHLPTDLLVEAIPYAETREYIKRVTGFIGAYRYLYGDSIPLRMSFSAPVKTGPWIDVRSVQRWDPDVVANPQGECRDDTQSGSGLRPRKPPAPGQ